MLAQGAVVYQTLVSVSAHARRYRELGFKSIRRCRRSNKTSRTCCEGIVAVSGYLIANREVNWQPLTPQAEYAWWYQYYFATERCERGYSEYRRDFSKLIWRLASPKWQFDEATFERAARSFNNPDHVRIVIHNYRWRLELEAGEPQYDPLEAAFAKAPVISISAVPLQGDADGAPHPDSRVYAKNRSGAGHVYRRKRQTAPHRGQ
jgi:hypothetical protein